MTITMQLAKSTRQVFFGGNWTGVNLEDTLQDINWQQAITPVGKLNTIALLVYHIHYYIKVAIPVLQGGELNAHDKFSFDMPPINSQEEWEQLLATVWTDVETFILLVEQLPEHKLSEPFTDEKYGSYYRNIQGITEHTHYHLGQVTLIKKMLVTD